MIFCIFRSELDRELEQYESEQRSSAKNIETFSVLTSEKVYRKKLHHFWLLYKNMNLLEIIFLLTTTYIVQTYSQNETCGENMLYRLCTHII